VILYEKPPVSDEGLDLWCEEGLKMSHGVLLKRFDHGFQELKKSMYIQKPFLHVTP